MRRVAFGAMILSSIMLHPPVTLAADPAVPPGLMTVASKQDFKSLVGRLEAAVKEHGMLIVARASASAGAAGRGVTIPGDAVLLVFRNDFAVRMLKANVRAGIEAPIPIHVFETADGKASLSYRRPSTLFKPYGSKELDEMAKELDAIFDRILTTASAG